MTGYEIGRQSASEQSHKVVYDAPEKVISALLTRVDQLTDALKALTAKLDADGGVADTNYASTISASLTKIELYI